MAIPPFSSNPVATFNSRGSVRKTVCNVRDYGAVGDTKIAADAAAVIGSPIINTSAANFSSSDVGKLLLFKDAGIASHIISYQSATRVTVANNATASVSGRVITWGTDDILAFEAARDAALPSGVVFAPPGGYGLSRSFVIAPAESATRSCLAPSLVAEGMPGRIGDTGVGSFSNETAQVALYPLTGFTQGDLLVDFHAISDTQSLNGAIVQGLDLICTNVAAGMLIFNTRRFWVRGINIDHAATPNVSNRAGAAATGSFNALQGSGFATAYNQYENISVGTPEDDGIVHNAYGNDTFINCYVYDGSFAGPDGSNYAYKCTGMARWIACHYESSAYGWYVAGGNSFNKFIGIDYFGIPQGNAVTITSNGNSGLTGVAAASIQFIACDFATGPKAATTEALNSIVQVLNTGGAQVIADFIGCQFLGTSGGGFAPPDWVYVNPDVANGSKVLFSGCYFAGTFSNLKFNDASGHNVLSFQNCIGIPNTGSGKLQAGDTADVTGPTAMLDAAASTTANASLRLRQGVAPSSPNAGDMWYDGTDLIVRKGSTSAKLVDTTSSQTFSGDNVFTGNTYLGGNTSSTNGYRLFTNDGAGGNFMDSRVSAAKKAFIFRQDSATSPGTERWRVEGDGWFYHTANVNGATPSSNQGLAVGWNRSAGQGETSLVYNTVAGSAPRLSLASYTGSVYTEEATLKGGLLGVGVTSPTAYLHPAASTTSAASLRVPTGSAPTSPNAGDAWHDSTQKTYVQFLAGIKQAAEGVIFTGNTSSSTGNVTVATSVMPAGVGTKTLPANFFVAGKTIRIKFKGNYTTTVTTTNATVAVKLGSTTIATTTVTSIASVTNLAFMGEVDITCYTTGGSGTVAIGGGVQFVTGITSTAFGDLSNGAATTTIDTTASQVVDVVANFGTSVATQDIKTMTATIEVMN